MVEAYVGGQWVAFSTTERDFLGRLPLGIETSFVGGSAKSWRFMRGPDVSGTLEGAGGARGVLAVLKDASSWKAVAADTLGNVLALAGVNGDFQRRTFDPWGNPLTRDASGNLRASTLQERRADYDALPLAWASQEVDPDTGLTHYHFREYSPSLGGWLTQDPIGLAGGYLNLRSYLGNRPADELDVWGEGSPDVFHKSMQSTAELKATREVLRKELERTEGIVRRAAPIQKNGFILPSGPYMPTPEFITPDQTECDEAFGDYAAAKERLNELYHAIKIFNRVIEIREATYGKINKRDRLWDDTDGNVREFVAVYNAFLLPEDGHPMTTHGLWASAKLTEKVGKAEYTAIELMLTGGAAAAERFLIRGSAAVVRPTLLGGAAKNAPIIMGENMGRVQSYANKVGGQTINDFIPSNKWSMEANKAWVQQMRTEGRQIIDIGPDFARRAQRVRQGIRPDAPAYNLERMNLNGYGGYQSIFERTGRYSGGVPGFDP
ncbi:MAG: hypothetical protein B9S29_05410 [Opitutia bacterium Tous-C2FEB]|nr:MAG: hypothetical protein B9S29_05410 [Opitutae bacterium Tous-C2FEB]